MTKLVSAIFYQIFIYHQMIALQKIWKMFFISSKKLFSLSRYSNFCISLLYSLSAIALVVDPRKILKFMMPSTVYDKNLTYFVWYLEKEIGVWHRNFVHYKEYKMRNISKEKSCRKCAPEISPTPLFNFAI